MTFWTVVALVAGVAALVVGAELLVKGAATIATRLGVAPVVIGLTVVAFGTSAPELAVSLGAASSGSTDVAFGNVVGSNIVNVLLILGASAVIGGLTVTQRIVRWDVPLVILASAVVWAMAADGRVGRWDGALLFAAVLLYTGWLIRGSRRESAAVEDEYVEAVAAVEGATVERPMWVSLVVAAVGFAALVLGSQLLVGGATDIAEQVGVSDLVIGLTVVAVGTSLPELATSVLAAYRGQRDIAVGNVIGSNLFNLLCVLGATGLAADGGVAVSDASLRLDVPVMLAAAIVLLPIFWNGFEIRRREGALLIGFYGVYTAYLILDAGGHEAADVLGPAALVVTPLVLLGLGVAGVQGWRRHRRTLDGARTT